MVRTAVGVIAGFIAWLLAWFGGEKVLSAIGPDWFGVHQRAFEAALVDGGQYTANTTMLLTHVVLGVVVTILAGLLAALIGGEGRRAPLILGALLLALGLMKASMSWSYVPLWYHLVFTALLLPMAVLGGRWKPGVVR